MRYVLLILLTLVLTGCYNKPVILKEIEIQEVYKVAPIDVPTIECRYNEANDADELINYLLECVINYEAYMKSLRLKNESLKQNK